MFEDRDKVTEIKRECLLKLDLLRDRHRRASQGALNSFIRSELAMCLLSTNGGKELGFE